MRRVLCNFIPVLGSVLAAAWPARAVDHNNLDAGRPLTFDDADSTAWRERDIEMGVAIAQRRGRSPEMGLEVEYLHGFALNSHYSVGLHPTVGGRAEGSERRWDAGDVSFGVFHNFNRELPRLPAMSLRADAYLPTGRDSHGVDFRIRGIASRSCGQHARLHLNLDLNVNNGPAAGERRTLPGAILGLSMPLGYPRRFDKTLVAEIGVRASPDRGENALVNVGLGLRHQVGVRSVFDIGVLSDIRGARASRSRIRFNAGLSTAF